jgi:hypothetical protein
MTWATSPSPMTPTLTRFTSTSPKSVTYRADTKPATHIRTCFWVVIEGTDQHRWIA